ncbi:hemolysin family protein [Pontibacter pamirensis]|uniref:hemolysin family protein n=1 Tax=Pontibacter pamirensis TaxID=2562824 RepID=UPI00138A0B80|nr:hemolysin family protein [Pontibacter pamirensis]
MELLILLLLILLNGVFSMSEIALVSAKKIRLESAARKGSPGARAALRLAESPNKFFSTVQIGITLIGILTGIYSGENITGDVEAFLSSFAFARPFADTAALVLVLVAITYFTLVLGELVPKRIGLANPESVSTLVARPMQLLSKVAAPFVWLLTFTSDLVLRALRVRPAENRVTEEEVRAIVAEAAHGGEVQEIEQDIVERVFFLGDRRVDSLMTYRGDIVFLNLREGPDALRALIGSSLYSVYPVFEGSIDNVVGVVFLKDLFTPLQETGFELGRYLKPVRYLAETTSAYRALEHFKSTGVHYSLVTDEYGTVMGIVTMNDILEALVGDVAQAGEAGHIQPREDGSWLVDGHCAFHDFLRYFGLPHGGQAYPFQTVAGLLLSELGHIPQEGERLQWGGLELEVIDMDSAKIDKVLVRRP